MLEPLRIKDPEVQVNDNELIDEIAVRVIEKAGYEPNDQTHPDFELVRLFVQQAFEDTVLFAKKHHDYGAGNIAAFGEVGVMIRLNDKLERLKNIWQHGSSSNEGVDDTWSDIRNYGGIGRLLRHNLWPGAKPGTRLIED